MSGAWTKGKYPWRVDPDDDSCVLGGNEDYDFIACRINNPANARLIAAAPGLYEALELARIALIGCGMNTGSSFAKIDAALTKARGES